MSVPNIEKILAMLNMEAIKVRESGDIEQIESLYLEVQRFIKTEYGYIDVRDQIKNNTTDLKFECSIMKDAEVLKEFGKYGFTDIKQIEDLKADLLKC